MKYERNSYTLAILVNNRSGVLMRVVALFSRRGYNIDSLSVGETEDPATSRITIVVTGDRQIVEQIIRQVEKLVDVRKVYEMTQHGSLQRELVLVKIKADEETRSKIAEIAEIFKAKIIDVTPTTLTMQLTGSLDKLADGRWEVRFYLYDVVQESTVDEWVAAASEQNLRMLAHRIADRIYEKLTGMGGLFCSRLAYVVQHSAQSYELIVADSDGANPAPALRSREPIISPAWSPDGRHLAYVSFEAKKPVVYVHTVATGRRRVVANFRGNNSAPAFSPDGQHLAVALSRDGYTQIFMIKTDGSGVNRFSRSLAIDTEPVFSPDGQWLYFVSDRGGSPQIYRQAISGGQAERVTFGADYAVSPTLSPDGAQLCYVTRVDGRYRVAVMELATGQEKILTGNDFDESPSFAPNGRMIVFASERGRKGVLGTVSIDGSVSAWLSTATGDIREPTWGPLLA